MEYLLVLLSLSALNVNAQYSGCDFFQEMEVGDKYRYEIFSRGYKSGRAAKRNELCRWSAEAPPGYKISLKCDYVFIFPLFGCPNMLKISKRGRTDLADAESFCGYMWPLERNSSSTRMTVSLKTGGLPIGSRFHCIMTAIVDPCVCGKRNNGKIVGGDETMVNEFPLMAGLTDGVEGIICGATIISSGVAVTAAHCFAGRNIKVMRLLVGEHDVKKALETRFTRSLIIVKVKLHENFNSTSNDNDIALVFIEGKITFNDGVGPSCLPIVSRKNNLFGSSVLGLGWGTVEFGGPRSDFLRRVNLEVVDNNFCNEKQLCTYTDGKDLCTYDSGGPVLLINNSFVFNVGIVSYGIACATKTPSANTRVANYLDWIMTNTKSTVYCVK